MNKRFPLFALLALSPFLLTGCVNKDSVESAQSNLEQGVEQVKNQAVDAAKKETEEAVDGVVNQTTNAIKTEAGEAVNNAVDQAQEAVAEASKEKTFTIVAKKFTFTPNTLTVQKGTPVKFSIRSEDVAHGFSLPEFDVEETLMPGKTTTVSFTPDRTGTFIFSCSVFCGSGHPKMTGELVVTE